MRESEREREKVSWCFEPKQPLGVTSGLERERQVERERERHTHTHTHTQRHRERKSVGALSPGNR